METAVLAIALVGLLFTYVLMALKIVPEHEQGIVTRFGRYFMMVEPGLHLLVPFVDEMRRFDVREVAVTQRIEPGSVGKIRIGEEEWDARTDGSTAIGLGVPIRITRVDGQVMVVTAV